jgi:hypothetical protein
MEAYSVFVESPESCPMLTVFARATRVGERFLASVRNDSSSAGETPISRPFGRQHARWPRRRARTSTERPGDERRELTSCECLVSGSRDLPSPPSTRFRTSASYECNLFSTFFREAFSPSCIDLDTIQAPPPSPRPLDSSYTRIGRGSHATVTGNQRCTTHEQTTNEDP